MLLKRDKTGNFVCKKCSRINIYTSNEILSTESEVCFVPNSRKQKYHLFIQFDSVLLNLYFTSPFNRYCVIIGNDDDDRLVLRVLKVLNLAINFSAGSCWQRDHPINGIVMAIRELERETRERCLKLLLNLMSLKVRSQ